MLGCKLHVIVGVTTAPHWKLLLFQAENEKQTVIEKPHLAQTGNQSYSSQCLSAERAACHTGNIKMFCVLSVPISSTCHILTKNY